MKPPKNFEDRVHRLRINSNGKEYELEVQGFSNDKVWVYSKFQTLNTIRIHFDWKDETYRVQVAKNGDGLNFFKDLRWYEFERKSFTTFEGFEEWMKELIKTCERLFNYE